jgi:RNA polymerase sigma factor (sigma-70 family)
MTRAVGADVALAIEQAHREWGFVLAATIRVAGDIDSAEEAVQDAYASALATWPTRGIPENPAAWLTVTARRRALDVHRREATARRALPKLLEPEPAPADELVEDLDGIRDERLRLVFTCCHPALAPEAQVALTLRLVCGLSTPEIARAFLVQEATMAARITRAKRKIRVANIPYRVPEGDELPPRLEQVLSVVHLVFTTGHSAPTGEHLTRADLAERGLELARMLRVLLPADPEVAGLLALVLLTDARRAARVDAAGRLVLLEHQDRTRWDRAAIEEGVMLVSEALRPSPPGRFALMAAIAAIHDESPTWEETDWGAILAIYDVLRVVWPTPVVELNRAIALGFADGPEACLAELDELAGDPRLARYPYLAAARADSLVRLGRIAEARIAYDEALILTDNEVEREFLVSRIRSLDEH